MDIDFSIRALKLSANRAMWYLFSRGWPSLHDGLTGTQLQASTLAFSAPYILTTLSGALALVLMSTIMKCRYDFNAGIAEKLACRGERDWNHIFLARYLVLYFVWLSLTRVKRGPVFVMASIHQASLWHALLLALHLPQTALILNPAASGASYEEGGSGLTWAHLPKCKR